MNEFEYDSDYSSKEELSTHTWKINGEELTYTQYENLQNVKWMKEYKVEGISINTLLEDSGVEQGIYDTSYRSNFGHRLAEVIGMLLLVAKKE